jgi:hypothetical protein
MHYLAACAVFRNEAPYLSEWIEFHLAVGVEHFYLYNNNSQDDFQPTLAARIADGTVTLVDMSEHPVQIKAYDHCLSKHRLDARWIAFIDVDEFLMPVTSSDLRQVLIDYEDHPAVCVNWLVYGSSGRIVAPRKKLIIEAFTRRAPMDWPWHRTSKSVVDPKRTVRALHAHYFEYVGTAPAVDERHRPVHRSSTQSVSVDRLRINHYAVKSFEEFLKRRNRGRATTTRVRPLKHFAVFDRNAEADTCAKHWTTQIRPHVRRPPLSPAPRVLLSCRYIAMRIVHVTEYVRWWLKFRCGSMSQGPQDA